ncbi:hypothetical protein Hypma_010186 [Hypsizygus marmoreus]|uniref:MARVEL domain-containing protein n=1 Tax=Hypsizygus marmoreus TaxID=39966 RepID=A0A369JQQ8_HYPMA|nr:hypothetical protein Hypma_010186 [Hypsizygus marmoreus]
MTVRFGNHRIGLYIVAFLLSGTVLGLAGNFASIFLPKLHHDFTIFSLIVPSLTILVLLLSLQWAQPQTEAVMLIVLSILWLTMGAWSTDIIGHVQCDGLAGQRTASNRGDTSAQAYCYQMKVMQAFSWALFILFAIAFIILLSLVNLAERFGRYDIWREPIRELPWFGEAPGFYNTHAGMMSQYPPSAGYMPQYGPSAGFPLQGSVMQTPGRPLVIQPGMNGQPATVTQM